MKLVDIRKETSVKTLREWEEDAEFWMWNAEKEGSTRGEKVWTTRRNAIRNRLLELTEPS